MPSFSSWETPTLHSPLFAFCGSKGKPSPSQSEWTLRQSLCKDKDSEIILYLQVHPDVPLLLGKLSRHCSRRRGGVQGHMPPKEINPGRAMQCILEVEGSLSLPSWMKGTELGWWVEWGDQVLRCVLSARGAKRKDSPHCFSGAREWQSVWIVSLIFLRGWCRKQVDRSCSNSNSI